MTQHFAEYLNRTGQNQTHHAPWDWRLEAPAWGREWELVYACNRRSTLRGMLPTGRWRILHDGVVVESSDD